MKTTLAVWVQKELKRLNRRLKVVDDYRMDVLEGLDDTDMTWFEESQRLHGSIDVLTKLEKAIKSHKIGAIG